MTCPPAVAAPPIRPVCEIAGDPNGTRTRILRSKTASGRNDRASKVVEHAKELLHSRCCERLSLTEIARSVGVTPVYLTQEFTRTEGRPLYRYQMHLRLNRALIELPHCNDITGLALDLGFSSHSHFTAVFRGAFGMTPSQYRGAIGIRQDWLAESLPSQKQRLRAA